MTEHGFPEQINAAVILGSGLGSFGNEIENSDSIPYKDIPSFPQSTVEGHSGSLIFGEVEDKTVLAFSGRFHHYEGHAFSKTVLPVQLAKAFEVNKLIISNAAGGINLRYRVGDLMIIDSIIKQFFLVSEPALHTWDSNFEEYAREVKQIARDLGIETQMGSYLFSKGPNYESKAEIRAFRKMGGDAVGMSTAPELTEAAKLGVKTAAISLITNAAAGVINQKLDHAEVKEAADQKKDVFAKLVKGLIKEF
ncbi:purine-nucleoside phosphorylase [Gracilimonas sp.]|uniref:purine-nucleoside phosphorylase n=1 Tax=Gracilimonas sp. TaxID=1974203 RepID=UPI0037527655